MLPDLLIASPILWEWMPGNADPGDEGGPSSHNGRAWSVGPWEGRSLGKGRCQHCRALLPESPCQIQAENSPCCKNTGTLNLILHSRKCPFLGGQRNLSPSSKLFCKIAVRKETMVHGNTYENVLGVLSGNVKAILKLTSPDGKINCLWQCLWPLGISVGEHVTRCSCMTKLCLAVCWVAPGSEDSCCKGSHLTDWSTTISNFKMREKRRATSPLVLLAS